jgi:hypothetical protein
MDKIRFCFKAARILTPGWYSVNYARRVVPGAAIAI